jgi:hypothetical protein
MCDVTFSCRICLDEMLALLNSTALLAVTKIIRVLEIRTKLWGMLYAVQHKLSELRS